MKTGVYCIRNTVNGKRYIGSAARDVNDRRRHHYLLLNKGIHKNAHLQGAWNKYSKGKFEFIVLCKCNPEWCIAMEQFYINRFKSSVREFGYNLAPTAGSTLGRKMADWQRKAISKMNLGKKMRADVKERMTETMRSDEQRERARKEMKERWTRPEFRAKMLSPERMAKMRHAASTQEKRNKLSAAQKAIWTEERRKELSRKNKLTITPEHLAKMRAARKPVTEEMRRNLSEKAKARWKNPKFREKQMAVLNAGLLSEETKAKKLIYIKTPEHSETLRQAQLKRWTPEVRQAWSEYRRSLKLKHSDKTRSKMSDSRKLHNIKNESNGA